MYRLSLASLLLALLTITAGCDSQVEPDAPSLDPGSELTAQEHMFLTAQGIAIPEDASQRGFFSISHADVLTFADEEVVGRSRMIRLNRGLRGVLATVRTSELEPGTATSLWMVVFNAPEHCSDGECGLDDLLNPDVRTDVLWVDGRVIGPSGRAHYFVFKREGDTAGSIAEPLLNAPEYGIEDARAAEIHYVVRTHGPVIPGLEREMTGTFNGGCQRGSLPDDPRLGQEGPNTCEDLQFALHLP